jgi:hypothetical protein
VVELLEYFPASFGFGVEEGGDVALFLVAVLQDATGIAVFGEPGEHGADHERADEERGGAYRRGAKLYLGSGFNNATPSGFSF